MSNEKLKKSLAVFSFGQLQNFRNLLNIMEKENIVKAEIESFVASAGTKTSQEKKLSAEAAQKRQEKFERQKKTREEYDKQIANGGRIVLLKPGEIELMPNVVCNKCKGEIFIEGLCTKNPLVKLGFARRGICGSCGNEFGIR